MGERLQFLTDHFAQSSFQRIILGLDMVTQGLVDQGLIVATTSRMHLRSKPIQDIGIQAYGNTCFIWRRRDHGTLFCVAKIKFFLAHSTSFLEAWPVGQRSSGYALLDTLRSPPIRALKNPSQGYQSDFTCDILLVECKGPLVSKDPDRIGEVDSMFS